MLSTTSSRSLRTVTATLAGAMMLSLAPLALAQPKAGPATESCEQLCSAIPTVKRWLTYLEKGKSRKAWRLMTRQSRRTIGGFEQFKRESSGWAEGWGAWARAKDRDFEVRVIAPMDDDADSVVTMTGRVAREGPYTRSAASLPVTTHDGATKVDPLHGKVRVKPKRPKGGEKVTRRPTFKAIVKHLKARYNSVYFVVKGSKVEPQRAKLRRIGDRTYEAKLDWPRRLGTGPHVLTIASWGRHGFRAEAVRFKVRS